MQDRGRVLVLMPPLVQELGLVLALAAVFAVGSPAGHSCLAARMMQRLTRSYGLCSPEPLRC